MQGDALTVTATVHWGFKCPEECIVALSFREYSEFVRAVKGVYPDPLSPCEFAAETTLTLRPGR